MPRGRRRPERSGRINVTCENRTTAVSAIPGGATRLVGAAATREELAQLDVVALGVDTAAKSPNPFQEPPYNVAAW
jgi:hypothetical protein